MRILFVVDGSKYSLAAVNTVLEVTKASKASVIMLGVVKTDEQKGQMQKFLKETAAIFLKNGIQADSKIRVGTTSERTIGETTRIHYDLIILGFKPKHRRLRWILGSSSREILSNCDSPVIIARKKVKTFKKFLLCDSGIASKNLLQGFEAIFSPLFKEDSELTILHVMSQMSAGPGVKGWELRADAKELIEAETPEGRLLKMDKNKLKQEGIKTRCRIRHGLVVEEILSEAREGDYDLIVIGAHNTTGWQSILLDDLAYQVFTQCDRPILILKRGLET